MVSETGVEGGTELLESPGDVRRCGNAVEASVGPDRARARGSRGSRTAVDSLLVPRCEDGLEPERIFTGVSKTAGNFT